MRTVAVILSLVVAPGFGASLPSVASAAPSASAAPGAASTGCEVVRFETSDSVSLEADWCPSVEGAPLLVLMHMIPPHHSRANYPVEVRASWVAAGFSVINVDRRGAGESGGVASDAYKGPKGKLDVAAALSFAASRGGNTADWACVGASNGTTSCLDYAAHAHTDDKAPSPSALVFMTGGTYTEAQTALAGSAAVNLPVLFTFNEEEKAWSEGGRGGGEAWQWKTYSPGGHGTLVFGTNPESAGDVATFLTAALAK